jgi:2-phospho-L-lactate/phosphoenolpyruvate guanylyltransferase
VSSITRPEPGWTVILPLKGGPTAKSRLRAPAALATAIALDCLDAVLAVDRVSTVVVVTPDSQLAGRAAAAGARVRAESAPGGGLLRAVSDGLTGVAGPVAVLLGDLPALRADDLGTALRRCAERLGAVDPTDAAPAMVFVPDAEGTGTVLLTALTPAAMKPAFGPASAAAHQAAGAFRLDLDLPRLRRDVDTAADLRAAVDLGVGVRTRSALAEITV